MSAFLRGKQAGISRDLSEGILPGLFALDDRARLGINSQISVLAYDPVQSLLAIGTNESTFGSGQIYIFGRDRVKVVLTLPRRASIRILQFCADRLISADSKNEIIVWDLLQKKKLSSYAPPGIVTALVTDPMLDWALIGLQNGEVICYDLDRERRAPLRLPNFWQSHTPGQKINPIVSMSLHPRDIGKLLIAYSAGVVIYSFKQNAAIKHFDYVIPPGAPGGNSDPVTASQTRSPKVVEALWHPSGSFVLSAHDDGSLVFWDPNDGRSLMARTLEDTKIDRTGPAPKTMTFKEPYSRIKWCCKANPDDSGILVAGGLAVSMAGQGLGLSFIDFGLAPIYATSSWQVLSDHFEGKRQHLLPIPPNTEVADFCLIPRSSPHYAGAQDPLAVICLLTTGELITLSVPSGHPIPPTNMLHPSLSFVHPFMTTFNVTLVERDRWLGMVENRQHGPNFILGGASTTKPMKRYEARNVVQIGNNDGTVRLWDVGHEDAIENSKVLQINVAQALGRMEGVQVSKISMGSVTGEVAVGTSSGEIVVYRWSTNKAFGRELTPIAPAEKGAIVNITGRSEPSLKEGLMPFVLYNMARGPVTVVKLSDIGFVGLGSEDGTFSIMDLRGPAIIYTSSVNEFSKQDRRSSVFRKGPTGPNIGTGVWACQVEFGVMTLDGDDYSSICCWVGLSNGQLATLKILPESNGRYTAHVVTSASCDGCIVAVCPIKDSGKSAVATGQAVAGLREGHQVSGTLIVVTESEVHIFRPGSSKGAHKTWDDSICDAASVTYFENHGYALVGVFGGTTRAYSIPALKELGTAQLPNIDKARITSAMVTGGGDIFAYTGPSELAMLNVWGTGQSLAQSPDKLYNPEAIVPPRPTISNLQWIAGTQYMSPLDLDLLIGGPDRPPSKRMMAMAAAENRDRRLGTAGSGSGRSAVAGTSQEGWGDYMTRQLNERTERLNIMGDSMERVQENSASFAEEASKWAGKQKRNIIMKGITGRFF